MRKRGPGIGGFGAALIVALLSAGCAGGDEDEPGGASPATSTEIAETTTETTARSDPARADRDAGRPDRAGARQDPGDASGSERGRGERRQLGSGESQGRLSAAEREAVRTVRALLAALSAGDGARVCALFAPGALAELELPRERGGCAASLSASIGFRDPRGLPVWESATVTDASVEADEREAKVVATVVTEFADRPQPSFEDDVVYLVRERGGWLVAKPSSSLYRAVGVADVPPSVLTPP